MITSGIVVDGVSHGLQAHLPYNHQTVHNHHRMSYVEPSAYMKSVGPPPPSPQQPQQQQQQQQSSEPSTPEFLRPLPKPAPVNPLKAPRASSKYAAAIAAAVDCRPVNLTAPKEPLPPPPVDHHIRLDDRHHPYPVYGHPRLYVSASPYHPYPMHQPPAPYGVYTSPYAPVIPRDTRHHLMQPPQERRYPSPPNKTGVVGGCAGVGSQASPSSSPPEQFKVPNGRDIKPPIQLQQQQQQRLLPPHQPVTSVATAPVVNHNHSNNNNNNNNNNNHIVAVAEPSPKKLRRNTPEPVSPPASKTSNFTKGSLIRLANGNIKKVEDMRTEDFLNSVENSDLHRIDPSTVVRIEPVTDSAVKGNIKITLSYGDQRNHQIGSDNKKTSSAGATVAAAATKSHQVEMESGAEHPYFVFGRGWASWSPAKTLAKYGLTCQRLQVGDVCVSLTKRSAAVAADSTTTTACTMTTAPTPHGKRRPQQHNASVAVQQQQHHNNHQPQQQHLHQLHHHHSAAVQKAQLQLQQQSADDDKIARNKRRWSAPDPEPAT